MSNPPEHKLELESQFILRLPPAQANALRSALKTGDPLAKRLSIKFDHDIRHGCVKFDNWEMAARLYDLPTIIESYKTLDRKNFYKTADISQILICKEHEGTNSSNSESNEEKKKALYDKIFESIGTSGKREYLYPHGITPPLKNVRKRRFRKTLRKKYVDFSEIEKEVKRLFKFDCEAIESRYEIVEENKLDKVDKTSFNVENASPMSGGPIGVQSTENSQNIDIHDLFGEECSSSDESDDDDDDDDRDDDLEMDADNDNDNDDDNNLDEEEMDEASNAQMVEPQEPTADIAAEIAAASDLIAQNDDTEEKKQELRRELSKIEERIIQQENEMRSIDNETLRMRLQPVLDSLRDQKNELKKQLDEIN